ncbi:MAG: PAS domain S-box protein, partial [Promethearchaeota archaeon]
SAFVIGQLQKKQTGEINGVIPRYQFRLVSKSNRIKWVDLFSETSIYRGRFADFVLMIDITEQKRIEEDQKKAEEALKESEFRYRNLFEEAPISLWEEDFSEINAFLDKLRQSGVLDFRRYFEAYPETVVQCALMAKILDVNKATLELFKAQSKEEILSNLGQIFVKESYLAFKEELIALAEGKTKFFREAIGKTLKGEEIQYKVSLSVFPGCEKTLEKILVSCEDITDLKKIEESLREAKEKYQTLVEKLHEGVLLEDTESLITFINPRVAEMLGYSTGELIGQHSQFIIPPEEIEKLKEEPEKRTNGISSTYESILLRKDGKRIPVIVSATPLFTDTGIFRGVLSVFTDITNRKKVEEDLASSRDLLAQELAEKTHDLLEEKARVETILESVPEGILVLDAEGRFSLANNTIKEFYRKISDKELPVGSLCQESSSNILMESITKLYQGESDGSITIEPMSGFHLQLSSTVVRIPGKTPFGVIIEVRDITPFIEFENRQKKFVSTASHELRTPISAILQAITNIQRYKKKLSEEQHEKLLEIIKRNTSILNQITEELLLVSKFDEKQIQLEWSKFSLVETLQEVLIQLEPRCKIKNIAIEVTSDPCIQMYGDKQKIGQIWRILLDNALKYSPEETKIKITTENHYQGSFNQQKNDGILIQVVDEGRGIRKEDLPNIFDRFFRSEDVGKISGTGLGLSIARELIRLHKGEIFVESEFGKGSTFSIFLPRLEEF